MQWVLLFEEVQIDFFHFVTMPNSIAMISFHYFSNEVFKMIHEVLNITTEGHWGAKHSAKLTQFWEDTVSVSCQRIDKSPKNVLLFFLKKQNQHKPANYFGIMYIECHLPLHTWDNFILFLLFNHINLIIILINNFYLNI